MRAMLRSVDPAVPVALPKLLVGKADAVRILGVRETYARRGQAAGDKKFWRVCKQLGVVRRAGMFSVQQLQSAVAKQFNPAGSTGGRSGGSKSKFK